MATRRIWPALLAMVMLLPVAAPAHARPRLALRVKSLGRAPTSARRGGSFSVAYTVSRKGSGLKRAVLRFYLSRTTARRHALRLAAAPSLKRLVRRPTMKGKAHLTVPAAAASGAYRLLACVERVKARGKPKLSAPCRAAAGTVTVVVPGAAPAPAPGGAPSPSPTPTPTPRPSPTPTPTPTDDPASPLAPADPLDVTPALDTAHRAATTIGSAGGTLDATGADGTTYELHIPAGALVSDQDISMTPVSSIAGLPFTSLVGAVDLQPDGLQLLAPARLTITPAGGAPPLADQSFFAYEGAGDDFHNYPPVNDSGTLAIDLPHFTGGGLAAGTNAQRAAVAAHTPAEYTAQYEAQSAAAVRALRDGTKTFDEFSQEWTSIAQGYYKNVVKPRLQTATTDDAFIEIATTTFSGWEKGIDDLGMTPAFVDQINEAIDLLRKGLKNAFDKSYAGCLAHDVGKVRRLVAVGRFASQLGAGIDENEIGTKLANCLHFRLDLILHLERSRASHDHVLLDASSSAMPLVFDETTGTSKGDLPWHIDGWDWDDAICFQAGGRATPVTPAKGSLSVDVNVVAKHLPSGATVYTEDPPKIKLTLDPGYINTQSQCAVNAGSDPTTGNGGAADHWFPITMHHEWGTFQTTFLNPFTDWIYQGAQEFPWATLFAPTIVEGNQTYDGQLQMILTHDPAG
jgi:hypothetical protein